MVMIVNLTLFFKITIRNKMGKKKEATKTPNALDELLLA